MPLENEDLATKRVDDFQFIAAVRRLKSLRTFMRQAGVKITDSPDTQGAAPSLYRLKYGQEGRPPTPEEWMLVETLTDSSFAALPESLIKKFFLGEIPSWVSIVPVCLAVSAVISLVGAELAVSASRYMLFPCYLAWLVAMGAIGSVAFIGMNALSVQQDVTFDLNNGRLMVLRIVLGAMFGMVLTLPFGFPEFYDFIKYLNQITGHFAETTNSAETVKDIGVISSRALALLMPFILGFSTSLVIMILNRLVDAVQAFFGRQTNPESSTASSNRPSGYSSGYGSSSSRYSSPSYTSQRPATPQPRPGSSPVATTPQGGPVQLSSQSDV